MRLPILWLAGLAALALVPTPSSGQKAAKAGEERSVEIADGVKMVFCWIPPGKATLGSPKEEKGRSEDEREHEYESKGFWLGKHLVTQAQWRALMKESPSYFDGKKDNKAKGMDTQRFPVENVSWDDCQGLLKKLPAGAGKALGKGKFCLPHEDEWEYAYRGGRGNKRPFYWGEKLNGKEANCAGNYPYGTEDKGPYLERTSDVGKYAKAAPHPWGLTDMSGNLCHWCENLYGKGSSSRVLRGGSWGNEAVYSRTARRGRNAPDDRDHRYGFRLAFRLDPTP
jgi:formylglycine-generating enzyme required for sulfatase activity